MFAKRLTPQGVEFAACGVRVELPIPGLCVVLDEPPAKTSEIPLGKTLDCRANLFDTGHGISVPRDCADRQLLAASGALLVLFDNPVERQPAAVVLAQRGPDPVEQRSGLLGPEPFGPVAPNQTSLGSTSPSTAADTTTGTAASDIGQQRQLVRLRRAGFRDHGVRERKAALEQIADVLVRTRRAHLGAFLVRQKQQHFIETDPCVAPIEPASGLALADPG